MTDDAERGDGDERQVSRRGALKLLGGGALTASTARVGYEVTGYGTVSGTNVTEQDLVPFARENLQPYPFDLALADCRLQFDGGALTLTGDDEGETAFRPSETAPAQAADIGASYGASNACHELAADLAAVGAGDVEFAFSGYEAFFGRLADAEPRPFTVAALRGNRYRRPATATVREFTGVDPSDPAALVTGLAEGFREHAYFDVVRYALANVQDHVLFGTVPLRSLVADETTLDALCTGSHGLYCWEYTLRSIEAFHAVAPHRQSIPVFGGIVFDERHNHVYTALASVVQEDGTLRVPMTFLDYSHSTMYDTYHLRWSFGDGVDAYNGGHQVSSIDYWNVYGRSA